MRAVYGFTCSATYEPAVRRVDGGKEGEPTTGVSSGPETMRKRAPNSSRAQPITAEDDQVVRLIVLKQVLFAGRESCARCATACRKSSRKSDRPA